MCFPDETQYSTEHYLLELLSVLSRGRTRMERIYHSNPDHTDILHILIKQHLQAKEASNAIGLVFRKERHEKKGRRKECNWCLKFSRAALRQSLYTCRVSPTRPATPKSHEWKLILTSRPQLATHDITGSGLGRRRLDPHIASSRTRAGSALLM